MRAPDQPRRGLSRWHFDIDKYLNPFIPTSAMPRLPASVAHFLGYRTHAPMHPLGNLAMIFWAVIGVFCSLAVIGAVARAVPEFQSRGVPTIIGSFGAAAVLDFYAIESPLAQPRNAILGQLISALTGISICKLFALSPHFEAVRWLGASLACACATALMALTGTVHPPAGATALMAVLEPEVAKLGWFLVLPLLLGCGLMLGVALLVNNVQRRFPFYWWSPGETGTYWRRRKGKEGEVETNEARLEKSVRHRRRDEEEEVESSGSSTAGGSIRDLETGGELARTVSVMSGKGGVIVIRRGMVKIPDGLSLRPEEILSLETLSERL
ncbi:HPP-domain-containing protein [Parathielavia appendiculata]|uniref:HPP-domain-containing protein n=1 Tax=Parathielavia appendiculata TaxID=2587402 RepID=A0AAN6TU60_9PEZI|nr:HPP-domain-containing protein [Parathielavia appendiculata]